MSDVERILGALQYRESTVEHTKGCRAVTTYTDGVDSWDEVKEQDCTCGRHWRVLHNFATAIDASWTALLQNQRVRRRSFEPIVLPTEDALTALKDTP